MANHKSALKRIRQNAKRKARNRFAKATIRTAVKSTLASLEEGNLEAAKKSATQANSLMDKAVIHGVLHKNNAQRRISRLNKKIAAAAK